ncbi:hypothetical protein JX265_001732 [Neoarthrinium moseri]|uniref:Uncharacterized protein n=1 Tax=Neoarthrinium moseri TaxID=1658444 RepID=A0A9Q0AVD4_9PEZI|nr:hypothetical protein JX266_010872 [Neoarthrinium moseri]KAI1880111.1 hypothetical protein JX265_001732 [Neoarthrinium moseri]
MLRDAAGRIANSPAAAAEDAAPTCAGALLLRDEDRVLVVADGAGLRVGDVFAHVWGYVVIYTASWMFIVFIIL